MLGIMYDFYENNLPDTSIFLQGDIVHDGILTSPLESEDVTAIDPALGKIEVLVKSHKVMIVSQTCDIQREDRNLLSVCPVLPVAGHKKELDEEGYQSFVGSLKGRGIFYWFYLPEITSLQESYADLTKITYINKTSIDLKKRIVSLSPYGRHWLSHTLSNFFCRPFK